MAMNCTSPASFLMGLRPFPEGSREAQSRIAFPQRTREIPVVPRRMRSFGNVKNHNGEEEAPSERKALCVLKS